MTEHASEIVPGTLVVTVNDNTTLWRRVSMSSNSRSDIIVLRKGTLCMTIASVQVNPREWHRCYVIAGDRLGWIKNVALQPYCA